MGPKPTRHHDSDDYFAETRMSFGDHLEDLRLHLWRAVIGFLVALVFGFYFGKDVLNFINAPVEAQLQIYWDKFYSQKHGEVVRLIQEGALSKGVPFRATLRLDPQQLREALLGNKEMAGQKELDVAPAFRAFMREFGIDAPSNPPQDGKKNVIEVSAELVNVIEFASVLKKYESTVGRPALATLNVQEGFLVYFKVSMVAGFVIASPWIFWQVWSFIAAGLYPHEKRYVNVFGFLSLVLFLGGVFLCQFFVIPKAIAALLWFNDWLGLAPELRLNEWLGFAIMMPLVFGISFQTPIVMLFLERIGVLSVESFRGKRRVSWFVMLILAAIITPTPDAVTLLFLWVPMGLLYELGILLCLMSPSRSPFDIDVPDSEEMIEA